MSESKDNEMNEDLFVRNTSSKPVTLYVEPWGQDAVLQPNEECCIKYCLGKTHREIEVEINDKAILIHFPGGSLAEIV